MKKRRELIIALIAGALTAPFGSFAQQPAKVRLIGFLWEGEQVDKIPRIEAFKSGMRDLGFIEGKDYVIEERNAQNDLARLPALAVELVALKVDLIHPAGTPSAVAAYNTTREIPILIVGVGDPIGIGLAATLNRPGGNVTGLTSLSSELKSKHLDLIRQMVPGMRRVGYLYDPENATSARGWTQLEADCRKLKIKTIRAPVKKAEEIAAAFNALQLDKAQGLIVSSGNLVAALRNIIVEQAAKRRLPAIYPGSIFVEAGGLFSYAASRLDIYRRAAAYAVKIFKGAKPGDLPIEQPTKFELVVNMKIAKALGIKIPNSILLQATKVIE